MTEIFVGKCLYCNKTFKRARPTNKEAIPKFCSLSCAAKYMWKDKQTTKVIKVTCENCGKKFKRSVAPSQSTPKFCSRKCHAAAQTTSVPSQFVCLHCNRTFERKYILKDHLPIFCGTACKTKFIRAAIDKALAEREQKKKKR